MLQHSRGPLFRNTRGKPWTPDSVNSAVDRIQIRMVWAELDRLKEAISEDDVDRVEETLDHFGNVKGKRILFCDAKSSDTCSSVFGCARISTEHRVSHGLPPTLYQILYREASAEEPSEARVRHRVRRASDRPVLLGSQVASVESTDATWVRAQLSEVDATAAAKQMAQFASVAITALSEAAARRGRSALAPRETR